MADKTTGTTAAEPSTPGTGIMPASMSIDEMMVEADAREIADTEDSLPVAATVFQMGKVEFDDGDIGYPRLRIGQQQTEEVVNKKAQVGQFCMSGFPAFNMLTATVIGFAKTRAYAVGSGQQRTTLCRALDGKHGQGTPGGECRICPKADWRQSSVPGGRNEPPECDETFNYILLIREYDMPVQFSLKKTGINTAKTLNSLIKNRGLGAFAFMLHTEPKTSQKSSAPFYVATVTVLDQDEDPDGELSAFLQQAQAMGAR